MGNGQLNGGLLRTLVLLSVCAGVGSIIATIINYIIMFAHLLLLNNRLRDVRTENNRLRVVRGKLDEALADTRLKLEVAIVENAALSAKVDRNCE